MCQKGILKRPRAVVWNMSEGEWGDQFRGCAETQVTDDGDLN